MKFLSNINKRYYLIAFVTFVTAIIVYNVRTSAPLDNELLFNFPLEIGEWHGKNIPMEQWVYDSLETRYAIQRVYSSPQNDNINFVIVWYDDKEIAFHDASACLGSSGDKVKEDGAYDVKSENNVYRISKLITEKYNNRTVVLYYYLVDGSLFSNPIQVRKQVMFNRLKLKRASAAFIRIMMPVKDDVYQAVDILEEFFKQTLPVSIEYTKTPSLNRKDQ